MKRHSSLAHLSREHHGALILARLLQKNAPAYKGLPEDTEAKSAYALTFYNEELVKHFLSEEQVLKLVRGINKELDLLVDVIFREHEELHGLFKVLPDHKSDPELLDKLGKTLEAHIRKEERELFPLMENSSSEALLTTIGSTLASST